MEDFPADDSTGKRVGKIILSGFLSGLFGVLIAEVVANSLVEISITPVFSIVRIIHYCNLCVVFGCVVCSYSVVLPNDTDFTSNMHACTSTRAPVLIVLVGVWLSFFHPWCSYCV